MILKSKYYVTTPVFDTASAPQIGFLYAAIQCDAIARHKRMTGFEVAHFAGADTHGANLEHAQERLGAERATGLERNEKEFEELLNLADVHPTHFQRTYSPEHVRGVETLLAQTLRHSPMAIYKGQYQGRYCTVDQIDVSDSKKAADCPVCGRPATLISEERYFFRLAKFQDQLVGLYKYRPEFIQPRFRLNDIKGLLATGLDDIPIGRRAAGAGIPWPDDSEGIVLDRYADLASYVTGIGFGGTEDRYDEFKSFWPASLQVAGKGALASHAIYWPAFLMAASLQLPRRIFINGVLSLEKEGLDKRCFAEPIGSIAGSDAIRYYLLREVGYGKSTRVGCNGLVRRCSEELEEDIASLANRILGLVARHCDGKIPGRSLNSSVDSSIEIEAGHIQADVRFLLDHFNFSDGIEKIWTFVASIKRLLADNARYEFADHPDERRRFRDVLYDACQGLAWIALMLHPILPQTTDAIWRDLGRTTRLEEQLIDETPWSSLLAGAPIGKARGAVSGSS